MNIMVPGPPFLCFVVYLEGDKKKIEEDTPFGRIARPFFNGNDDEFRNNRFKLIPRVRLPPPPYLSLSLSFSFPLFLFHTLTPLLPSPPFPTLPVPRRAP
jgi:hypothetical protein